MALNSGEAEEQGKQDVSGLSADIVMEDASLVEPVQGAPASLSSTLEPPSLEASGDSGVLPAPEAAEPAEPSSSSRVVGPRVHYTPDVLEDLLPSRDFALLLDENAWRFRVECKVKGQVFESPYQNKTFSRAFNDVCKSLQRQFTACAWSCRSHRWHRTGIKKRSHSFGSGLDLGSARTGHLDPLSISALRTCTAPETDAFSTVCMGHLDLPPSHSSSELRLFFSSMWRRVQKQIINCKEDSPRRRRKLVQKGNFFKAEQLRI